MNCACKLIIAATLLGCVELWDPSGSTAATPKEQLQETWGQIVVVLKGARFDSKAEIDAFRIKIMEVVSRRFDFAEMAKRCLGAHWAHRSHQEQEEFTDLLAGTLARSYISGIRSYEDSTVSYAGESREANNAVVETRIIANGAKNLAVNYKMHLVEEDWRIYDVVIDDISLVDNYRSQFHRVITQSSYEALVRIMKDKQS